MINDLFRTYKKIIILLLVLLCSVVFWFYGCRHQQRGQKTVVEWDKATLKGTNGYQYKFKTKNCTGNVVFGVAGYVAKDKVMPVTLHIRSTEKSFTGVMKVTLPGENGKGIAYQSAVKCSANQEETVILNVPQLGNPSVICFEIMDSFGVTQLTENVSFTDKKSQNDSSNGETELLLGVLSDQPKQLSYLNKLEADKEDNTESIKIVSFSQESFPENIQKFQGLDGMIIDSFDTSQLSNMQKSALRKWVKKSGGKLLIAGGSQKENPLEGIGKWFGITEEGVGVSSIHMSDGEDSSQELLLLMSNLSFSSKYTWNSYGTFEPAIAYTSQVGQGSVSVLRFSLANGAFLQWGARDSLASDVLTHFLEKDNDTASSDTSLWYVKKALYAFMKSQLPNTFYYGVFFIFYILLIVTIAYYYLRKIKKREYIWIVVPVLAIFFTVGMIVRSRGMTGNNDSSFSALRVKDTQKKQETIYFLYQSDEGEEASVNFLPSVTSVVPMDYNYRTISGKNVKTSGEDFTINNTKNGFDIAFEESVPGSSRLLKLSGSTNDSSQREVFTPNLSVTYTGFSGDIKNISGNNFSRVILMRENQYVILKNVKAGAQVSISESMVKCWNRFDEENSTFGTENENTVTGNLMEYLQQTYMNTEKSQEELLIVGITNENDFKLFSDNNVLKNHVTMMINHFDLKEQNAGEKILNINISCLEEKDESAALEEDALDKKKTEVTYIFDRKEEIQALARNRDNFRGKIYAYNYQTKQKDRILSDVGTSMDADQLEPYLSDSGEMLITYQLEDAVEYETAPVLSLIYDK